MGPAAGFEKRNLRIMGPAAFFKGEIYVHVVCSFSFSRFFHSVSNDLLLSFEFRSKPRTALKFRILTSFFDVTISEMRIRTFSNNR